MTDGINRSSSGIEFFSSIQLQNKIRVTTENEQFQSSRIQRLKFETRLIGNTFFLQNCRIGVFTRSHILVEIVPNRIERHKIGGHLLNTINESSSIQRDIILRKLSHGNIEKILWVRLNSLDWCNLSSFLGVHMAVSQIKRISTNF